MLATSFTVEGRKVQVPVSSRYGRFMAPTELEAPVR